MEPDIAAEYDRLMDELQEAVEADPHSHRTEVLRGRIEAFLREHLGSADVPASAHEPPDSRTTH